MNDNDDTVSVTTSTSWLGRCGNSLGGAVFGVLLFLGSFVLLFWNEGRAVDAIVALDAGARTVTAISADTIQPANEGRLVHLSGPATVSGPLADKVFRITAPNALRLRRQVEMYQWREKTETESEKSVGGSEKTTTTYRYVKDWSEAPIDSASFHKQSGHANPAMPHRSLTIDATGVRLGAFTLDQSQIELIDKFQPLPPLPTDTRMPGFRWEGEVLYRGASPDQPQIGDLRVTFQVIPAQTVSVVAAQMGNTLAGYQGLRGRVINLVSLGAHGPAAMFEEAKQDEAVMTWILRGVGFLVMLVGLMLMASPILWLVSLLPILESVVGALSFGGALLVSVPLTLLTIAVAWLAHRPLIGIGLIAAAVVLALAIRKVIAGRRVMP